MENLRPDRKNHILDVAQKLFSKYGFDGATTRMISREAGVNLAMLNYYFGSKEGLFLAIFERKIISFPQCLHCIGFNEDLTTWEKLAKCIDKVVESIIINDSFQELINRELVIQKRWAVNDKIAKVIMKNVYEVKMIIDEGVKNGHFNQDADTAMLTATLFGTKNYIMNIPHLSSLIIGNDVGNQRFLEEKLKPRIKVHIKKLFKAYLL